MTTTKLTTALDVSHAGYGWDAAVARSATGNPRGERSNRAGNGWW